MKDCGCKRRREKIARFFRRMFPALLEKQGAPGADGAHSPDPRVQDLFAVLKKFDISPEGPNMDTDKVNRQTVVYQQMVTWIIDYDADTMRCMMAKRREDDFRV